MSDEAPLLTEMTELLVMARPMMELKCCHFDWCLERRGVVSEDQSEGLHEIDDGMHPGCRPYRDWLDRCDVILGNL